MSFNSIKSSELNILIEQIVKELLSELKESTFSTKYTLSSSLPAQNKIVDSGTITLKGAMPKAEVYNFAKLHWNVFGGKQDTNGIWNFTVKGSRGQEIPCCKVGFYRGAPAILNALPDNKEHLLTGNEILKDLDSDMIDKKTDTIPMKETSNEESSELSEMTTTGNVAGYNIPGAFSKRGGSQKAIKGSEKLGYTLTNDGEKEMSRHADKL